MTTYFVQTPANFNCNTSVATGTNDTNISNFFELVINTSTAALFNNFSYRQNAAATNLTNVTMTYNANFFSNASVSNIYVNSYINGPYGQNVNLFSGRAGTTNVGQTLLEIVALSIFGHPNAQAAIDNDSTFATNSAVTGVNTTLGTGLISAMQNALNSGVDANNIFNQYTLTNYYIAGSNNNGDVNAAVNFNFTGLSLKVPIQFGGKVVDSNGAVVAVNGQVNIWNSSQGNATAAMGFAPNGQVVTNGVYNMPICLTFNF